MNWKWSLAIISMYAIMIPAKAQRQNAVFGYYQAYDEFSFDPQISQTLNRDIADINYSKRRIAPKKSLYAPYSFGLGFQRAFTSTSSWRFSTLIYNSVPRNNDISGESIDKTHLTLYGGYSRLLRSTVSQNLMFCGSVDGVIRAGSDTYWVDYGNNWVDIYPARTLADMGVRVGLNGTWHLNRHVFASAEINYTRWLFLYSNVFDRSDLGSGLYPLKPGNQLEFNVGIGYSFGAELAQVSKRPANDSVQEAPKRHRVTLALGIPYLAQYQYRSFGEDVAQNTHQPLASLKYSLSLKSKWGLYAKAGYQRMTYFDLDRGFRSRAMLGTVSSRDMGLFELGTVYSVLQKWISLNARLGIAYRHGDQYFTTSTEFETNAAHQMRDIGGSFAVEATKTLTPHIEIGIEAGYTYFFYRKENGLDRYPFDRGPSRQMITACLGLSYRF